MFKSSSEALKRTMSWKERGTCTDPASAGGWAMSLVALGPHRIQYPLIIEAFIL